MSKKTFMVTSVPVRDDIPVWVSSEGREIREDFFTPTSLRKRKIEKKLLGLEKRKDKYLSRYLNERHRLLEEYLSVKVDLEDLTPEERTEIFNQWKSQEKRSNSSLSGEKLRLQP